MSAPWLYVLTAMSVMVIGLTGCSDSDPIRGQFVAGCMHAGATKSDCHCIYNKLKEKYGHDELNRLSMEYPPGDGLMKSTMAAAMACRN